MGVRCERINLSASTTLQQLLGGFTPRLQGGVRVFSWQDGKLLQALRRGDWLLLDELNLAPPEVLDGVAPLLHRCGISAPFVLRQGCSRQLGGSA